MNNIKTAVFSVVYPGVEEYLEDFFFSIENQDDKDFELYVVNDGLENFSLWTDHLTCVTHIKEIYRKDLTPTEIRKIGIKWLAQENIEFVVFSDSDDYFSLNRVNLSKKMLKDYPAYQAVVNELILTSSENKLLKPMFGKRLKDKQPITEMVIRNSNCCGLSNSSVYLESIINLIDEIPNEIIAFDWQLYTRLLMNGTNILYTNEVYTYYRQHGNNIASPYTYSEPLVLKGIYIKYLHYNSLKEISSWYLDRANKYKSLLIQLKDNRLREIYIKRISDCAPENPFWWEMLKPLEELE